MLTAHPFRSGPSAGLFLECVPERILDPTGSTLDLTLGVVGFSVAFQLGIADCFANGLFDRPLNLFRRPYDPVLVHSRHSSWASNECLAITERVPLQTGLDLVGGTGNRMTRGAYVFARASCRVAGAQQSGRARQKDKVEKNNGKILAHQNVVMVLVMPKFI